MTGHAIVDGREVPLAEAVIPVTDPGLTVGWSVFETLRGVDGRVAHLEAHLDRLERSCVASCLPMPPRELLAREVRRVAEQVGGDARVRVTITAGGRRIVFAHPLETERIHRPVRVARAPHVDDPFLPGDVKHGSRAPWMVAVQRAGVDDVLFVDGDRFTEGTTCAVLAVIGGVLFTAAHDGRILPSTTCNAVLARADALGVPVRREGPPAFGPWDALYVASTTRLLAPVTEIDGEPLPGWDPVGRRLAGLDRGGA